MIEDWVLFRFVLSVHWILKIKLILPKPWKGFFSFLPIALNTKSWILDKSSASKRIEKNIDA